MVCQSILQFYITILIVFPPLCLIMLSVLHAYISINNPYLQVHMEPKQGVVYSRVRSKSVAPFCRLVIGSSDDEREPEFIPSVTQTPSRAVRTSRSTPKRAASDVVTVSQSYKVCTLTGTLSGSAAVSEKAFVSTKASRSEKASYSHGDTSRDTSFHFASSEEANSADCTLAPLTDFPAPVTNQPNWWCVEGQYQIYRDVKLLKNKGVMTRTLTIER